MVFGFGPALLSERGLPLTKASSVPSLFMVVLAVAVPLGGILADPTGRRDGMTALGLVSFAVLVPLTSMVPPGGVLPLTVLVAVLFGLSAGPIVGLPSGILAPEARPFAMGVYFTIYYA